MDNPTEQPKTEIEMCESCGRDFPVAVNAPQGQKQFCPRCRRPYLLEE